MQLPRDVFDVAYSQAVLATVDLPGIIVIIERIPLRSNLKLLKEVPSPKVQAEVKQEWDSLKQRTIRGDIGQECSSVIATTDERKLIKAEGLKRFQQERSNAAVDFDDQPQKIVVGFDLWWGYSGMRGIDESVEYHQPLVFLPKECWC